MHNALHALREFEVVCSAFDQPANEARVAAPKAMQLANLRSAICAALSTSKVPTEEPPTVGFRLRNAYPHDSGAFTQGLYYDSSSDTLVESTGLYGE